MWCSRGLMEGKPADLCSTGPRLNPLIHLNLPHIHAGWTQIRRQQWLCVLVFFQVLPCSACPSAAVAPPGHTLAPLPISQSRRPNMSHLAGQSSTGKGPCHYKFAPSQKTSVAVATSYKKDCTFTCRKLHKSWPSPATAPVCTPSHTMCLTKTIPSQHKLSWNHAIVYSM